MQSVVQIAETPSPNALPSPLGEATLLLLTPSPGVESATLGALVSRCCARGRPPYLVVLTDGSRTDPMARLNDPAELARRHERETRAATAALGLDDERVLFVRVHQDTLPAEGALFEALVSAVTLLMWARDCGIVVAPAPRAGDPDSAAAAAIAATVAARTGVGYVGFNPDSADPPGTILVPHGTHGPAKDRAMRAHALLFPDRAVPSSRDSETYFIVAAIKN